MAQAPATPPANPASSNFPQCVRRKPAPAAPNAPIYSDEAFGPRSCTSLSTGFPHISKGDCKPGTANLGQTWGQTGRSPIFPLSGNRTEAQLAYVCGRLPGTAPRLGVSWRDSSCSSAVRNSALPKGPPNEQRVGWGTLLSYPRAYSASGASRQASARLNTRYWVPGTEN